MGLDGPSLPHLVAPPPLERVGREQEDSLVLETFASESCHVTTPRMEGTRRCSLMCLGREEMGPGERLPGLLHGAPG